MTVYAGWQLVVQWKTGSTYAILDGIQRISYNLISNIEAKEECGTRYPKYLIEGTYATAGALERFYTGSGVWPEFMGTGSGEAALPWLSLKVHPNGTSSAQPYIEIAGVKMEKISVAHRPGSNLMTEAWDFIGTGSVTIGTN